MSGQRYRFEHVSQLLFDVDVFVQSVQVDGFFERIWNDGSNAGLHFDDHAQRLYNHQNITENDGSVQVVSLDWLQGDFARELRCPTDGEKIIARSQLPEFG